MKISDIAATAMRYEEAEGMVWKSRYDLNEHFEE
jgi:hypothetical protein